MSAKSPELSRREFVAASSGLASTQLLGLSVSGTALGASNQSAPAASKISTGKKNILFIFTDQERYINKWPDKLSLPGHDRLARDGVTFTNHYVSSSMCTSSRSVMLTGLQTIDNGMFDNVDCPYIKPLSTKIPTIGHMLRKSGYHTAYRGKWHLSQDFEGHDPDKSLIAKMDEYGFGDFFSMGDGAAHALGGYQSDEITGASVRAWLRQKGRPLSDGKQPWSLFVSLVNPHDIMYFNADAPGENKQDSGKLLMSTARAPKSKAYETNWRAPLPKTLKQAIDAADRPAAHGEYLKAWGYTLGNIPMEHAHWDRFSDFYFNSIRQVDVQIAAIMAELEVLGLRDTTMVVFTADHGEMGGAHGLRGKGPFAYEEAIHVPFNVVHPDVKGGQQCGALSSHIDIVPTLLSLAGVKPDDVAELAGRELPGKDLSAALSSPGKAEVNSIREQALFTYSGIATNDSEIIRIVAEAKADGKNPKVAVLKSGYKPNLTKRGTLRCAFDGRYKFVRYFSPLERNSPANLDELFKNNDVELFDLKSDPLEATNLASDRSKNSALIATMNGKLEAAIKAELGKDDGREMPHLPGVDWALDRIDL